MRFQNILVVVAFIALLSCNSSTAPTDSKATEKITILPVHSQLSAQGTSLLMNVVNQYLALKNALVASKALRADSAAVQLANAGDTLQKFLAKDTIAPVALKPYLDTIINYSKSVNKIGDPTCERQRLLFGTVSGAMYGLLRNVKLKNAGIYHEYCPMAFNEKGAYWLSEEAEIKNPYFGKKMLECGEVTDSLK